MRNLRFSILMGLVALSLVMSGAALLGVAPGAIASPALQATTPRTVTLIEPTLTTTGTTYSAAPLLVQGQDAARTENYSSIALFATTSAGSSGTMTATLQISPDREIWVDSTEIVYSFNTTGTLTANTITHRITLSGASQTGVVRTGLAGAYMRVRLDVAGTLTPTVKATLR